MKDKTKVVKIIILIVIVLCMILCMQSSSLKSCNATMIKTYINSYGAAAPVIYIIMFTIVPLTLFPDSILAIAGGMAFGVGYGAIYTIIGAVFGASLSFGIARFLGRGVVDKLIHGKGKFFEEGVEKRGFLIILLLRLIPLVPFDIISYGAGVSKIKFKDFLFATVIGIIPGVLIFINLGDKSLNVKSPEFIISVVLLILLFAISYILKKKISFNKIQENIIEKENTK